MGTITDEQHEWLEELYLVYRQVVGDYKLGVKRWHEQKQTHEEFALWLETMAGLVRSSHVHSNCPMCTAGAEQPGGFF